MSKDRLTAFFDAVLAIGFKLKATSRCDAKCRFSIA